MQRFFGSSQLRSEESTPLQTPDRHNREPSEPSVRHQPQRQQLLRLSYVHQVDPSLIRLNLNDRLGEGGFGYVIKGFYTQPVCCFFKRKVPVACKMPAQAVGVLGPDSAHQSEYRIMRLLPKHDHLIQLLCYLPHFQGMVLEFCNQGTLFHFRVHLRREIPLRWFCDLSSALLVLKTIGVIHRDLKPENILIHRFVPKIADFGLACHAQDIELNKTSGTLGYMAPEMFLRREKVSHHNDVWGLGAVFFFMVFDEDFTPFLSRSSAGAYHRFLMNEGQWLLRFSECVIRQRSLYQRGSYLRSMLKKTLHPNPKKRFSAEELSQRTTGLMSIN
tara:strand:- start:1456 stop:2448 length:993 start_codon:yes stop_codon:yes gene_type:complete